MDDWATSSPWAETTRHGDDDPHSFHSPPQPPPLASNGQRRLVKGGIASSFPELEVQRDPFGHGWGFGGDSSPHDATLHLPAWKLQQSALALDDGDIVPAPEAGKLKPERNNWEYKNEWARSEDDLSRPRSPNVWNKGDGWGTPEPSHPPEAREQQDAPRLVVSHEEQSPQPPLATIIVPATNGEQPGPLKDECPSGTLDTERKGLGTTELEVASSSRAPSSLGDDFGDFEDEDTAAAAPAGFNEEHLDGWATRGLEQRKLEIENFTLGDLAILDDLYTTKPCYLPARSDTSEIISTTSQRKTWYKLIRKESARNSIQGEDVLRVRWSGSVTQQKVHNIVKRWISEDRINGLTVLGRSGGGTFDWNSSPPPSVGSNPLSPALSGFKSPKLGLESTKRSSTVLASPTTPRSPAFSLNSTQSPQIATFGWTSAATSTNPKDPTRNPNITNRNIADFSSISASSLQTSKASKPVSRHTSSSSVDLPRAKTVPGSGRPISLLVDSGSRSLFGELAAMKSPPVTQSPEPVTRTGLRAEFSNTHNNAALKQSETPMNASFDDDFGDFEGPGIQSPSPPPDSSHKLSGVVPQAVPLSVQPGVISPALATADSIIPLEGHRPSPPLPGLTVRSSFDIVSKSLNDNRGVPPGNSLPTLQSTSKTTSQSTNDPWDSFDIFDAPKQAQPTIPQAAARSNSSPPAHGPRQQIPGQPNDKPPVSTESKRPALPVLVPRPISLSRETIKPVDNSGDFDDWGDMVDTASSDQKVDWVPSQTPKLSVSSEPEAQVRRRSWTLDMFGSPEENITSANPVELLDKPKPPPTRRIPSPISVNRVNNMPTIPATPSPGATSLFSPGVLVPQRVPTPTTTSHPSSARSSVDLSRQNSTAVRNGSFASLNSLSSLSIRNEGTSANNRQAPLPVLQTQPTRPSPSPQPSISSPLSTEWDDADFGFFDAVPKSKEKNAGVTIAADVASSGRRSAGSVGSIPNQRAGGKMGHAASKSVTIAPIVGKKDEDAMFDEIIGLLPDLGYMLK